jgi:hypothetical protein
MKRRIDLVRPPLLMLLCCLATGAFALDSTQERITRAVDERQSEALELLAETVNVQSATENHAGVRRVGEIYAREFAAIGFETSWVELPAEVGRAGHFVAVHRTAGRAVPPRGQLCLRHRIVGHEGWQPRHPGGAAGAACGG